MLSGTRERLIKLFSGTSERLIKDVTLIEVRRRLEEAKREFLVDKLTGFSKIIIWLFLIIFTLPFIGIILLKTVHLAYVMGLNEYLIFYLGGIVFFLIRNVLYDIHYNMHIVFKNLHGYKMYSYEKLEEKYGEMVETEYLPLIGWLGYVLIILAIVIAYISFRESTPSFKELITIIQQEYNNSLQGIFSK